MFYNILMVIFAEFPVMLAFLSFCSSLIIGLFLLFSPAWEKPVLASIFHFEGSVPTDLGVRDGKLKECPPSPNCVVSQTEDNSHYIAPLEYRGDRTSAYENFLKVLSVVPDTVIVAKTDNYIRTESRSKIMGFVDDAEFYFPEGQNIIQWRSASRLGESDLGVNRRRLEQIRLAFNDLTANN